MSYQKMDPKAKAAWLEALRSGRYEQGSGNLRTSDGKFCCLGVLCDLGKNRDKKWDDGAYGGSNNIPPTSVLKAAKLGDQEVDQLWWMNDGLLDGDNRKRTFPEIADWIDANL